MYARAVDDAASRLRELHDEERDDFGLAALAIGLAIAATQIRPALALALLVGGFAVLAFAVRALWRRWDLVDRLAGERDAYVIPEVREFAAREATMERRRSFAALIRGRLNDLRAASAVTAADELESLAAELDDGELVLDPACAVACMRLLREVTLSPLFNTTLPRDDLLSRVRQIRCGFEPRRRPSGAGAYS